MSAKAKAKAALKAEVLEVRANMDTHLNLGRVPKFKDIRMKALQFCLWVCSCMVCPNPVKDMTDFTETISGLSSLNSPAFKYHGLFLPVEELDGD